MIMGHMVYLGIDFLIFKMMTIASSLGARVTVSGFFKKIQSFSSTYLFFEIKLIYMNVPVLKKLMQERLCQLQEKIP